jgi:type II secretory pathway pseudopilin PulG
MRYLNNEKGIATLIALIMVGMLTLIGLAALSTSDDEINIAGNQMNETRAFYAAEAGLEVAAARLHNISDSLGVITGEIPAGHGMINDSPYSYETVEIGSEQNHVLTNGSVSGMHARVRTFSIISTGSSPGKDAQVAISQMFERVLIPVTQYGIFSHDDLEMNLSSDMTFLGRVHTNGNLWVQTNATAYFNSYLSSHGNLYHGRKSPGSTYNGDVLVKDGTGNYVSMKEDPADWLDAYDSHWYDSSIVRWDGRVQDSTHAQGLFNIPLFNADEDPYKIIEPTNGNKNPDSYENDATIKIVNGKVYEKVGEAWSNITTDWQTLGIVNRTGDKFYDDRENEWVDVTDFDIKAMYDQGYSPTNGIIYFSDTWGDYPALRLKNAGTIQDSIGITIASNNPVYTQGDFNKDTKKPASIISDAFTVLSAGFDDLKSALPKEDREATSTIVNAAIITGNIPASSTTYTGGAENIIHFLEDWDTKTLTFTGSLINMWASKQSLGAYSTAYFNSPNFVWSYDQMFDYSTSSPPGVPTFELLLRTGWKQQHIGYVNVYDDYVDGEVIIQ